MNKFIKHEFDKQFIEDLRKEYKYFVYAKDNFYPIGVVLKIKHTFKLSYVEMMRKQLIF